MVYNRSLAILAFVSLTYLPATASAQAPTVAVGVKGGVNLSKVAGPDTPTVETLRGGVGGMFVALDFNESVGLQFEALVNQRGFRYQQKEVFGNKVYDTKVRINYIDFPVLARFGSIIGDGARIYGFAGPTVSLRLGSAKATILVDGEEVDEDDLLFFFAGGDEEVEPFDFGVTAGAGVQLSRLVFDLRYTVGIKNIPTVEVDRKNRTLSLMVGYRFK